MNNDKNFTNIETKSEVKKEIEEKIISENESLKDSSFEKFVNTASQHFSKYLDPNYLPNMRGSKVFILRKHSFWHKKIGVVTSVTLDSELLYKISVKFDSVNYSGSNTSTFAPYELVILPVNKVDQLYELITS